MEFEGGNHQWAVLRYKGNVCVWKDRMFEGKVHISHSNLIYRKAAYLSQLNVLIWKCKHILLECNCITVPFLRRNEECYLLLNCVPFSLFLDVYSGSQFYWLWANGAVSKSEHVLLIKFFHHCNFIYILFICLKDWTIIIERLSLLSTGIDKLFLKRTLFVGHPYTLYSHTTLTFSVRAVRTVCKQMAVFQ